MIIRNKSQNYHLGQLYKETIIRNGFKQHLIQ